jgi:phosphoglycerate dehydrogenase-like enzyme
MSRLCTRSWHHATSRTTAPIVEAKMKERPIADSRPNTFSRKALRLNHPLRRLDGRLGTPHIGCEITQNYGHYYIEMIENIAAWLKDARVRALR